MRVSAIRVCNMGLSVEFVKQEIDDLQSSFVPALIPEIVDVS